MWLSNYNSEKYNKFLKTLNLKDSFGNTVTDFVFDKGFYKKQ